MPLRWEYAFGGSSVVPNPEHALDANTPPYLLNKLCYSNPLGRGWIENATRCASNCPAIARSS
ncbi:DUF2169 domain-containing protein [Pseudomonas sp. 13B_2.1_Bac1]|uniref:DUF2169 domain-containing protein n=1 Tax=Pseudomonas sp. 13B_2.1_Bac1 TaxID=2971624 RepID=UPI0021C85CA5|nr:DUF2169 domain-containing protein [Pseudomonas sp. 13B_2.1_Bac1]MCU1781217.1 DUF2169 domain-containing protein [Pseudomonas sp. 13B_2.1_Bac1]